MSTKILLRAATLGFLVAVPAPAADKSAQAVKPPVAKKAPHVTMIHGDKRVDDYHWLRKKHDPDVIAYLEAENAYCNAMMKSTEALQTTLYGEFLSRLKQTDISVPYRKRGYVYFTRTEEGKQYPIYCRLERAVGATDEVMIDGNEMAKGQQYFSVGRMEVSDDGKLLAFTTDTTGFREYQLSIKDLRNGRVMEKQLVKATDVEWAADNATLYYVTEDHAKRPYRLYRHKLGQPKEKDELVLEEKDERFHLVLSRTRDGKYLLANFASATTSEVHYLAADEPGNAFRVILPRQENHQYSVDHRDGTFYITTNRDAKNFRLVTAPVGNPAPMHWRELVPHRPDVLLESADLFRGHMVLTERERGLPRLVIRDLDRDAARQIEFGESAYSVSLGRNEEFDTTRIQYHYQSFVTPLSIYELDLATHQRWLLKQTEVLGGFDPSRYRSERIFATAKDGVQVPIALVYKKGVERNGKAPLLLYGYGSYGSSAFVFFNPQRLSLLDRGVIFALAAIRGGSDLGRQWYEDGKLLKKMNTFTDFIACADHLIAEKYTSREKLAIQGGSAGGLLIGATLNLRPDLCKAAVLQVPFVDVVNTMLDPSLPLTVPEYLEWGNPNVKEQYEYIKRYCPYTNLKKVDYPSMLLTTSLNDSQVMYWEPAKYTAKLRTLKTDRNPLIFRCNMAGSHGGSSGRYDRLKEDAFVQAFILDQLGAR